MQKSISALKRRDSAIKDQKCNLKPQKVIQDQIRPNKAKQGQTRPYKAVQGHTSPYKDTKGVANSNEATHSHDCEKQHQDHQSARS